MNGFDEPSGLVLEQHHELYAVALDFLAVIFAGHMAGRAYPCETALDPDARYASFRDLRSALDQLDL